MKLPKIIAADIDGTLVEYGIEFSGYSRNVINCLREQGVLFGLASGRPFEHMIEYAEKWGFSSEFDFFIGMNGAELMDTHTNEVWRFHLLKKEDMKEIVGIMSKYDCNGFVYEGADMYVQRIDDNATLSAIRNKILNYVVDDTFFYSKDRAKVMFRFNDVKEVAKVEEYFAAHPSDSYSCFKTQENLLEFADKRTNKIHALKKYCEIQKICLEDVLSVGDTSNDNELLKQSGFGVCLLNGSDDTKACADAITEFDCRHDGFARFLEKELLLPLGLWKGEKHV